jgi:hypothetical protein
MILLERTSLNNRQGLHLGYVSPSTYDLSYYQQTAWLKDLHGPEKQGNSPYDYGTEPKEIWAQTD